MFYHENRPGGIALTSSASSSIPGSVPSPKPCLRMSRLRQSPESPFTRLGSSVRNVNFDTSLRTPKPFRGVQFCEDANDILEISTRSVRVERGDLALFYSEDYEPDPVIECFACKYESESDTEAGNFRIFNLPDGGWQMLCPRCDPPDPAWEFDRTVAVVDILLPPDIMQLIFLFLSELEAWLCAGVCHQWDDLSWTVLTLRSERAFARHLHAAEKMRNVWVLRACLDEVQAWPECMALLCDNLHRITTLFQLQLTGVRGDAAIKRLAQALQPHATLQVLDLGACDFKRGGLQAILAALAENQTGCVELILPKTCMDTAQLKYATTAEAQQAVDALLVGSNVNIQLVG